MRRTLVCAIASAATAFLFAGGCLVPTRHGAVLLAPTPHGVAKVRVPGPAVPAPRLVPVPAPKPRVPNPVVVPVPRLPTPVLVPNPLPPVPRVTVKPARPHADHVWVDGHYVLENGSYVWRAGVWVRPPRVGGVWVPPVIVKSGNHWKYTPGHWR
ncbi:MAG: hypothetical protein MUC63_08585 [Planctomycetes bacterium]|jgi:hypothetical protein|nr:hypothetical protein [Planctomycetota bacterium]